MAGWVGRTLGKVKVELLLARGGIADVYLGRHATLKRAVAVKVLKSQYSDDPELLERFQREARVVAMLRHPNIVQVHDFDSVDGHPYLIMEYVPGVSLAAHLRALHASQARMDLNAVDRLLGILGEALQYAHDRGVIHRDVKPANVLLTSPSVPIEAGRPLPDDFQPILGDFGLVRFLSSTQQTSSGQVAGTPAYMSPEQASGAAIDARTDVYSLGIVLYELLAGRVPFDADSALTVLNMQVNDEPASIPDLPQGLQQVIDRALQKDPGDRFGSPRELVATFQAAQARQINVPAKPERLTARPTVSAETKHAPGLRGWLSTGVAALVTLVLAGVLAARSLFLPTAPAAGLVPPAGASGTRGSAAPAAGDPVGVLRFRDGSASVDEVSFHADALPLPEPGSQYEVWLITESGEERRSVGYLTLDANGEGTTSFVDPQGRNLLSAYGALEITLEPTPDSSPNPAGPAVFTTVLPADGLLHVRHLLVSFSRAPEKKGLLAGLLSDAELVSTTSKKMLDLYQTGDEAATRAAAEAILNVLVGRQSPDYADWDHDGKVDDPGDGYGLLLNGDNSGYIQGSSSHAEFAASAPDATDQMQSHGQHVITCTKNLEQWTPQLRDLMKQILASTFDPAMGGLIRQAVALSDRILTGTDANGNERIEPIPGEGGAQTAYQHALYMADMVVSLPR